MKNYFSFVAFIAMVVIFSCSKSGDTNPDTSGFDKSAMLRNYADTLIIPGYASLQQKLTSFQTSADAFLAAPSVATQSDLKTAFTELYLQYEKVAAFQFGPAETELLDIFLNFSGGLDYNFNTAGELTGFSVDSVNIENNISTGSYNLTTMNRASFYSQGFPAMGYLFFGPNAIDKFSVNTTGRVKYSKDVIARMKTLVDKVASSWTTYRTEFIGNTQTNVGSPIGNIVNQLAYQADLMKGPRIGWPFGKQSNGTVFSSKTEAFFTKNSVQLAVANLSALKNTYTGGSGKGIDDYLVSLNNAALNNDILAQFDHAIAALSLIPDPLSASLTSQPTLVENAYKEIQKLLTLLKTDLASATAVQINYMDNDGD